MPTLLTILQNALDAAPAVPRFTDWVKTTLKTNSNKLTKPQKATAQAQYEAAPAHRIVIVAARSSNVHQGLEKIITGRADSVG